MVVIVEGRIVQADRPGGPLPGTPSNPYVDSLKPPADPRAHGRPGGSGARRLGRESNQPCDPSHPCLFIISRPTTLALMGAARVLSHSPLSAETFGAALLSSPIPTVEVMPS
ncbi:hypothetical protein SAMD00023353_4200950 [Rosellinia necatrix]|uniref:Uncharacterized protein n=1 Tax=Rosellinia necatrix TaxID=77044 RepID=A0A1S8A9P4_ROSNE|nr:hypothetical protein SAMD00023353_4200950 [Rosellinia necatrix]